MFAKIGVTGKSIATPATWICILLLSVKCQHSVLPPIWWRGVIFCIFTWLEGGGGQEISLFPRGEENGFWGKYLLWGNVPFKVSIVIIKS